MAHKNYGSTMVQQILDRRQGRLHTVVIRNISLCVLWYVKVNPHQDFLTGYI